MVARMEFLASTNASLPYVGRTPAIGGSRPYANQIARFYRESAGLLGSPYTTQFTPSQVSASDLSLDCAAKPFAGLGTLGNVSQNPGSRVVWIRDRHERERAAHATSI
jgi:hypothetical protein